ncbi:thiolase, N-terminal domain protein [Mycobacterium kansasii]|uniref:Thiolase, N-terminal domain protein n=1 Tax=Mycobacterium kansasii TaxID=1768 RepID=A0A1V3W8I6_MYCKA|nr:thiolase, N-terminal domain protein [Mycobacterium kansasii]
MRTAVGKRNGALAGVHPLDLGAGVFRGLFERVDVDPAAVEDVIVGCVDAVGGQAGNIGRLAWLARGIRKRFRVSPSTGNAVPVSRRFPLGRKRLWRRRPTSSWPAESRT